jgi:hypothetical protein
MKLRSTELLHPYVFIGFRMSLSLLLFTHRPIARISSTPLFPDSGAGTYLRLGDFRFGLCLGHYYVMAACRSTTLVKVVWSRIQRLLLDATAWPIDARICL